MYHRIIITGLVSLSLIGSTVAAETPFVGTTMSYSDYKTGMKTCTDTQKSWNAKGTEKLIAMIDYPELTATAVNTTISKWKNEWKELPEEEKTRLTKDLDTTRIGNFTGFKALEVARIGYRTQMNRLFACAIIDSRLSSIVWLQEIVNKKVRTKSDEFTKTLKNESEKYNKLRISMKCAIDENGKKFDIGSLTDTAAYQYCGYRHYLNYLDANTSNVKSLQDIEKNIGTGDGTQTVKNISDYTKQSNIYSSSIAREIVRADTTLPKALRTFLEMDQTYQIHILLADFIYADYVNLRKSLAYYMVLSSQLYQKAFNAQSTNK
jgi:hypothetical protein